MLVSIDWIKEYVRLKEWPSNEEFCDKMIMSGSNIETVEKLGEGIKNVKIGRIEKIEQHPNADRLLVCDVNLGEENVQIVTNAKNVFEGAFVPVAVDGAVIPDREGEEGSTIVIKSGELRGVKSDGMLCGAQELGIHDKVAPLISKDGIWILPGELTSHLGEDAIEALYLKDSVVDFEITPNRPDCLSMIGMGREVAATFGGELIYPVTESEHISQKACDNVEVEVRSNLCKRYTARVITDVKIEQSPWWFQKRLIAAGMRPINNMVDITNFVMLEYGQPLHAFDITSISGNKIIVDKAKEGDLFTTLDGVERTLDSDMLMISDSEKHLALAGIMGGLNSEITDDTKTVVIESANFESSCVRRTSKKLALRTESSSRYEKGIDPNLCEDAADRVCKLIAMIGCGKVMEGSVDIYEEPETAKDITVRVTRVNELLGTDFTREYMESVFRSLEIEVKGEGNEMILKPPTVRRDLLEEVDFVEEIARIYGYDNLPSTLLNIATGQNNSKSWNIRCKVKDTMCAMGYNEIQTFSFINGKTLDNCSIPDDSWERDTVKIINPMGEDTSELRTILMPDMLEVLSRNKSRSVESVKAFEIGKVFSKSLLGDDELPSEAFNLSAGIYGQDESFFTLKSMVEGLLDKLNSGDVSYVAETDYSLFHPGRCARIIKTTELGEKVELGIMGQVHPDVCERYNLDVDVYCVEMFIANLIEFADTSWHYVKPPKYPAMSRDIAMVVDESVQIATIKEAIEDAGGQLFKGAELFDIYRGEQVGEGKKSVAFNLKYRHDDRTLTDSETQDEHMKIIEELKRKLDIVIRDN